VNVTEVKLVCEIWLGLASEKKDLTLTSVRNLLQLTSIGTGTGTEDVV
jgi:hypothetical protein